MLWRNIMNEKVLMSRHGVWWGMSWMMEKTSKHMFYHSPINEPNWKNNNSIVLPFLSINWIKPQQMAASDQFAAKHKPDDIKQCTAHTGMGCFSSCVKLTLIFCSVSVSCIFPNQMRSCICTFLLQKLPFHKLLAKQLQSRNQSASI